MSVDLRHGDCLAVLADLPDASVDAVVTDPPYGLANTTPQQVADTIVRWVNGERDYLPGGSGFMGRSWDAFVPPVAVWDECLRVLKPGGHVLAFAGSRTHDLMTLGLRLAGFDIRDSVAWLYGSGFPKSLDVSKAIDKAAGAEREVVGLHPTPATPRVGTFNASFGEATITAPATPDAERWQGWGTALKPAFEPVVMARKPMGTTVAANVLAHGTGALNIDGCRLGGGQDYRDKCASVVGLDSNRNGDAYGEWTGARQDSAHPAGRWPANVVLDESQAAALDEQSGERPSGAGQKSLRTSDSWEGGYLRPIEGESTGGDTGGASRFFYVAKAGADERVRVNGTAHPTVKPLALMRWLVRLVTPPGGTVLDPFAGSGTTGEACILEGFDSILIEREAEYLPLIRQRIARRRDPVEAVKSAGGDAGLFDLLGGESA